MVRSRVIVGFTGGPLLFLIIYIGGWPFWAVTAAITVLAIREYGVFMSHMGWRLREWLLIPLSLSLLLTGLYPDSGLTNLALGFAIVVSMLHSLWQYEREGMHDVTARWFAFVGGLLLFGWMGSHLLRLRTLDVNGEWTLAVLAIIWGVDVCSYFIGRSYGKRPLVPRLSPKKSIEGYVGGIVAGIPLVFAVKPLFYPSLPWEPILGIAILFSLILPAGDLFFSLLKREAGLKDASQIIPGHGGILDRLDTVLWGTTISYYILTYLVL